MGEHLPEANSFWWLLHLPHSGAFMLRVNVLEAQTALVVSGFLFHGGKQQFSGAAQSQRLCDRMATAQSIARVPAAKRDNHTPSCAVCQRRKVKCDRVFPCAPCTKTGLQCEYKAVTAQPTRKRRKRVEDEGPEASSTVSGVADATEAPQVDGRRTAASNGTGSATPTHSFLFGPPTVGQPLQADAWHVIQLWQAYLTNVDPLIKILHTPSAQQLVLGQIGKKETPPAVSLLTCAICFISTVSLNEDECQGLFQTSRIRLLMLYRGATEAWLSINSLVSTTDLRVLQSFILYLSALHGLREEQTAWSMSGLALRIGVTMGLAEDSADLPPFEREMRRRAWWALIYLDSRIAEGAGQHTNPPPRSLEVPLPANVNDTSLSSGMQHLPESSGRLTEMSYVLYRCQLATGFAPATALNGANELWTKVDSPSTPLAVKADLVDGIERFCSNRFLQLSDSTVPLQAFIVNSAKTHTAKMRLVGNIPADRDPATAGTPHGYSENLFQTSKQVIELQLELLDDPSMQKWRWHWSAHSQWYALAELMRQTRMRPAGAETAEAWDTIRRVFDHVLSNVHVPPERLPLVSALKGMVENALRCGESTSTVSELNGRLATPALSSGGQERRTFNIARIHGARPHHALLPGINEQQFSEEDAYALAAQRSLDMLHQQPVDWEELEHFAAHLSER